MSAEILHTCIELSYSAVMFAKLLRIDNSSKLKYVMLTLIVVMNAVHSVLYYFEGFAAAPSFIPATWFIVACLHSWLYYEITYNREKAPYLIWFFIALYIVVMFFDFNYYNAFERLGIGRVYEFIPFLIVFIYLLNVQLLNRYLHRSAMFHVLSLTIMAFSYVLFDLVFFVAHILKLVSAAMLYQFCASLKNA